MSNVLLIGINALYYFCLFILCVFCFFLLVPVYLGIHLLRGARLDDAARRLSWTFGRIVLAMSRPLVRIERIGAERVPRSGPCVFVANHRSFVDVFLCAVVPLPNIVIAVREWPFRIPVLGWFMRLAGYIHMEVTSFDDLLSQSRGLVDREVSFLFFPEGHRSRDGRLQRFRSGAFRVAAETNLPVVPVVITGTEILAPPGNNLLRPATIRVEMLAAIEPASFPEEKRALKLRRATENVFREHLGEADDATTDC